MQSGGRNAAHRRPSPLAVASVVVVVMAAVASPAAGQSPSPRQWDESVFEQGLLKLRLLDLLEYHLEHNPPRDELAALLIRRDMELARRDDPKLDDDARRKLLSEANAVLERIITEHPADKRALDWRMKLARSLLYEEAEPYYSDILYRGATGDDRTRLQRLMRRTTTILSEALDYLKSEYDRLDEISISAYERLEQTGYVGKIESAMPEVRYMLRWARFYLGLSLDPQSRERRELMAQVLTELRDQTRLLTRDHAVTHVQAQSLLLAGMTSRLLGDYPSAIRYLGSAVTVTSAIPDAAERSDLRWVATLGSIERVRTLRDAGRFDDAQAAARRLASLYETKRAEDFGMRLIAALLESDIELARAADLEIDAKTDQAKRVRQGAMSPLEELANRYPDRRDEVYATVYELTRGQPRTGHPFETCAIIAGQIAEANKLLTGSTGASTSDAPPGEPRRAKTESRAVALLDDAIAKATSLLAETGQADTPLRCEARFNLAVAQFRRGLRFDAATNFLDVAQSCGRFPRSESAATYAVEIAAQLAEDPGLGRRTDVRNLFMHALHALVDGFADTKAANYWRFFLAQALEDTGDLAHAAQAYERVTEDHPQYLVARFRSARCAVNAVKNLVHDRPADTAEIRRRAVEARAAMRRFLDFAADRDEPAVDRLSAEATVLLAEVDVLPGINKSDEAITRLEGFENKYGDQPGLLGRVLRTRIIAYQAAGKLDQARAAVPQFMASAPRDAGPTLQALFDANWSEVKRLRRRGQFEKAAEKARSALLFAQQLYDWAHETDQGIDAGHLYYLRLQLAEAKLESGRLDEAKRLFEALVAGQPDAPDATPDPRVLAGLAEVMYRSGNYGEALPVFNRLYRMLPVDDDGRFHALLRDLQCRTELGQDAQGIINVIKQHRFLSPDLGGAHLKSQFLALLERNQARVARR